jgi:hypothetical protein
MSDLHLEFDSNFEVPEMEDDKESVLVLAGDICTLRRNNWISDWLVPLFKRFRAVVYVPGNHEYYGSVFPKAWHETMDPLGEEFDNFYPLDIATAIVDGVKFIGATLWTNFFNDAAEKTLAAHMMNDYRAIKFVDSRGYHKLRPGVTESHNYAAKHFLADEIHEPFDGPTVVVTHHGPSRKSIDPKFADSPLNGAYVNDLDNLLEAGGELWWIHGHVHHSVSYQVGEGRVLTNPRGYITQLVAEAENPAFDPCKYIEV